MCPSCRHGARAHCGRCSTPRARPFRTSCRATWPQSETLVTPPPPPPFPCSTHARNRACTHARALTTTPARARARTQIGCRRGEHWQGTQGHCNPPRYVLSQGLMNWLSPLRCTHLQLQGWAHPCHICTRTGLSGEGESREHRSRNRGAASAVIVRKPFCAPKRTRPRLRATAPPSLSCDVSGSAPAGRCPRQCMASSAQQEGQCAAFTNAAGLRSGGRTGGSAEGPVQGESPIPLSGHCARPLLGAGSFRGFCADP
jgi:hypothetical protein